MARSVTRKKNKFAGELSNVTFQGSTLKLKMFVLKNIENLFSTDWRETFKSWDIPINSFCQKLKNLTTEAKIFYKRFKTSRRFFWGPWLVKEDDGKIRVKR